MGIPPSLKQAKNPTLLREAFRLHEVGNKDGLLPYEKKAAGEGDYYSAEYIAHWRGDKASEKKYIRLSLETKIGQLVEKKEYAHAASLARTLGATDDDLRKTYLTVAMQDGNKKEETRIRMLLKGLPGTLMDRAFEKEEQSNKQP